MKIPSNIYDIIIGGAGGAGLSFAYHLSKSIWANKKILLLDKDSKEANDRTWCYWSKESPEFQCAKEVYWEEMSFIGAKFEKTSSILPYRYYHIKGIDFYKEVREHLLSFPNIEFRKEAIMGLNDCKNFVEVHTEKGNYQAKWYFNSIPRFSPVGPLPEDTVKQYFKGYFIKTVEDSFLKEAFRLMDFSMGDTKEIRFFYVLPYSTKEALVECTVFSTSKQNPENYCNFIQEYIQNQLKIQNYAILEEEKGMIPMSTTKMPFKSSARVFHIGTVGGMTKATTGYTFKNIQVFCKKFLEAWQSDFDNPPAKYSAFGQKFKFYDGLLLHLIRTNPSQFQAVMEALFKQNDFKSVLKFLDEDSLILEDMMLFARLPWKPFIKALYEQNLSWLASYYPLTHWRSVFLGGTSYP